MTRSILRLVLAVLLSGACTIPGIAPEGQDARVTHTEIPATPAQVHERAFNQLVGRMGYAIVQSDPPTRILARRTLDLDRWNVIEVRLSGTDDTRAELHGWTEIPDRFGRRKAPRYDPTLGTDVQNLSASLMCPAAPWPRCP